MESIISTFHIDWKIIIAQAVNFGIVFVVLYIFALKPLAKLMAERSEKIGKGLEDAKTNEALLQKSQAEYEAMLLRAKTEADKIFQEGKKEAENKKLLMIEDAKKEVENILLIGRKTLEADKAQILNEAKNEIVALAMQATEKILGAKVDRNFDQKNINDLNNL